MAARETVITLREPEPFGVRLQATLPNGAAGAWVRVCLGLHAAAWWAKLELTDEARGQIVREAFLGAAFRQEGRTWRQTLVHVPTGARHLVMLIFGDDAPGVLLTLRVLTRPNAALALLWHGRRHIPAALAGSPSGARGRLRALLGQAPARDGEAPPYMRWIAWFEAAQGDAALSPDALPWKVDVAIVAGSDVATDASVRAAQAQTLAARSIFVIRSQADWRAVTSPWVVPLQAGEILAPDALAMFAQAAFSREDAVCITADCDRLALDGTRHDPLFKPSPDLILLRSGLPVRGACALRWQDIPATLPAHAETVRHVLASRAPDGLVHLPRILSHIRPDCLAAPPCIVARHAAASGTQDVTILIPTAASAPHVVRCIGSVVRGGGGAFRRAIVTVSGPGKPAILRRLSGLPGVELSHAAPGPFHYARVNNDAARDVDTEFLLLMNDDVSPIGAGWLHAMVGHMADRQVGIVGARLLYGNNMVQHEGVIMGLANLCEHAGRLRPNEDAGVHGMGRLDREVSAVTAACLLVRTALYRALGGMDEGYAIALNDVDLCLRAREAGWRVVYCASALLHHYESLSLGRHYAGARAALEGHEVRRLRRRFGSIIASDPFYSPHASLQVGREWLPAFPPRPHGMVRGPGGRP